MLNWFNIILPNYLFYLETSSVQSLSLVWLFATPWTAACQASLSTNSQSWLKLMSIKLLMPSNHLILCCPLLLLPSIFPASRSFLMSQIFPSVSQSIGASASVLPMNIQDWFPSGLTGLISLQSKGLSRVFSNTTVQKYQFFVTQLYGPTLTFIHDYWKNHSLTRWAFVGKVMSLIFNILSRLVIAFLPRSKYLLISRLQSPSAVILEPKKIKSVTVSPSLPWSDGIGCHDLHFLNVEF